MGRLTRAIIVATLTVALIAAYAAAAVTLNTPTGQLFVGATYFIGWTISGSPPTSLGIINIHNADNNNITVINDKVNFTSSSQMSWVINVVPGNYYFGANDGSGEKNSGQFQIVDRSSSATGNPPAATTAAGTTAAAGTTTAGNTDNTGTAGTTAATGTNGAPNPTTKSGAATLQYNLLGLFVGLGLVASVMIQLF